MDNFEEADEAATYKAQLERRIEEAKDTVTEALKKREE